VSTAFPTYLWHYLLARFIYDHLGIAVAALVAVALLVSFRRR
jgi:hypothetical protein